MKKIMIFISFLLLTAISNGSTTINTTKATSPVPEVVACEMQETCEMTPLTTLYLTE